jgi:hypothetical protein
MGQTKVVSDVAVTLEEVILTPGASQAIIKISPPDKSYHPLAYSVARGWDTRASNIPGSEGPMWWMGDAKGPDDGRRSFTLWNNLSDSPGKWTLTITSLDKRVANSPVTVRGPWIFQFTVP